MDTVKNQTIPARITQNPTSPLIRLRFHFPFSLLPLHFPLLGSSDTNVWAGVRVTGEVRRWNGMPRGLARLRSAAGRPGPGGDFCSGTRQLEGLRKARPESDLRAQETTLSAPERRCFSRPAMIRARAAAGSQPAGAPGRRGRRKVANAPSGAWPRATATRPVPPGRAGG